MNRLLFTFLGLMLLGVNATGFDLVRSRSLGMGRTVLLSRPTPTDLINYTAHPIDSTRFQFEAGYHRRFELADLDNLFLATSYHLDRITIAFGAAQFGKSELYAEQLLKGSLAFHSRSFTIGGTVSAMQIQIGNGYGGLRAATYGVGAAWSRKALHFSLSVDNLSQPTLLENGSQFNRTGTFLAEFQRPGSYSITARLHCEDGLKPQYGLGQTIRLSERSSFFWGIGNEPLEYGGGFEIDIPVGSISYAASVHPVLGLSHAVSVSFRPVLRKKKTEDDF